MKQYNNHGLVKENNKNRQALFWTFLLIASFMIVEVIGGLLTNSLALLSDAGHMLSDAVALGLSYFAIIIGQRAVSSTNTFGYRRFEIFAAFINGLTLIGIAFVIIYEAIQRFSAPPSVASTGMLIIATLGLIVNIAAAFILHQGDNDNLNVKSAFLHVIGDLLGSIGAIVAALLILLFDWQLADPIASIVVAMLIMISGFRVTRDSFNILMEAAPANLDTVAIEQTILSNQDVLAVTDLHVWSITSDYPSFTCHVIVKQTAHEQIVLRQLQQLLYDTYDLHHMTIQIVKHHLEEL